MEMITPIVIAVLASNGIFALLQFLITRNDSKKNIKGKLNLLEKDGLRTQLLLLLLLMPEETKEILTISEHYFKVLNGDWYMTSLFDKWLDKYEVAKPEWFKADN